MEAIVSVVDGLVVGCLEVDEVVKACGVWNEE